MTNDPEADFLYKDRYDRNKMIKLPKCSICRYRIMEDSCYRINGYLVCNKCLDKEYQVTICEDGSVF